MSQIDWNKVAEDYEKSVLDRERLNNYALKAAEGLKNKQIPFDGYTDDIWLELQKSLPKESFTSKLKRSFFGYSEDRNGLQYQHIGYWILETSQNEKHFGNRYTESYFDRHYLLKTHKQNFFMGHGMQVNLKWVLLENGCLAFNEYRYTYNETSIEGRDGNLSFVFREIGCAALVSATKYQENKVNDWHIMTENDALLLDHKKRTIKRRFANHEKYDLEEGTYIGINNYLLTGKRGGGCSKKITALLKKHQL